jgi:hypothetical protein
LSPGKREREREKSLSKNEEEKGKKGKLCHYVASQKVKCVSLFLSHAGCSVCKGREGCRDGSGGGGGGKLGA